HRALDLDRFFCHMPPLCDSFVPSPNLTTGRWGWQRRLSWRMSLHFTADERRELEHRLARCQDECPRCGGHVDRHTVPQRSDVAYVRDRVTVTCAGCGAT